MRNASLPGAALAAIILLTMTPRASAQDGTARALTPPPPIEVAGACGLIIYNNPRVVSNNGAEITAAANGPATTMGDLITVVPGGQTFVCEIVVPVFATTADLTPFDLTMRLWTDCSTSGAGNSPCGNGIGTLIPNSTLTVAGIVPQGMGVAFNVVFIFPPPRPAIDGDSTFTVSLNASRPAIAWLGLGDAPTLGTSTDCVERCGSVGANNGCCRNFGLLNNFNMVIFGADAVPVELQNVTVE